MSLLTTIALFIFAVLLLVSVHEFGHFIVARCLGVQVLQFSIGFGKALWSRQDSHGTRYIIAAIPLGGYVRMLDEREGPVPPSSYHLAFNRKPLWIRTAVVIAGPLFNFLFAIAAFWMVMMIGVMDLSPVVGKVEPHSIAAQAGILPGDEFEKISDKLTPTWTAVRFVLLAHVGEKESLPVQIKRSKHEKIIATYFDLTGWQVADPNSELITALGITPYSPPTPRIIGEVVANSPASLGGVQAGDEILAINGHPLEYWQDMVQYIEAHPGVAINLDVLRAKKRLTLAIMLGSQTQVDGKIHGVLGVRSLPVHWPETMLRQQRYLMLAAIGPALKKTWEMTALSGELMVKMLLGDISPTGISGPIGIARGISYSASLGFTYFLSILGLISINLGVVNLLPIPVLDGGHLLYFFIEGIRRKPLSLKTQQIGLQLGIVILMSLMIFAVCNDLVHL